MSTLVSALDMLGKPGDCFVAAFTAAQIAEAQGVETLIVHGLPIGTGSENLGKRFWHAWIETPSARGWDVLDLSSGRDVHTRRTTYYRAGRIDGATHVWRYTLAEAIEHAKRTGHAGPWVPGSAEMGL